MARVKTEISGGSACKSTVAREIFLLNHLFFIKTKTQKQKKNKMNQKRTAQNKYPNNNKKKIFNALEQT